MRRLARGVEALVARIENDAAAGRTTEVDVVVVGSGYGGAVAAARFAQAGYSVCLLERGREYIAGEFPNDIAHLPGHVRMHRADGGRVVGNRDGLFDLRVHRGVTVLVGNALGGTSQINANVALRADPEVLRHRHWPRALREPYDPLDAYYTAVEDMLRVAPYPNRSIKAEQLERFAPCLDEHVRRQDWAERETPPRARFYRPPLAVNYEQQRPNRFGIAQDACVGCGDCVTGCNYAAKNTLTMNYLPAAAHAGAQLYTGATVIAVEPQARGPLGETSATLYFSYSDVDWSEALQDGRLSTRSELRDQRGIFRLRASIVVLAAGTLGSTEILLRSRELGLLAVSPCLGAGFSGNGDALGFGYDQDATVNGVGWGANETRYRDPQMPQLSSPGPSIVGVLDVRDGLEVGDGVLIEDGIIPGAVAHLAHEALATAATLAQLNRFGMHRGGFGQDPLALSDEALRRTQTYLFMGHDEAGGTLALEGGRVVASWSRALQQSTVNRQSAYLRLTRGALGAVALRNPFVQPLPEDVQGVLSGPPLDGNAMIVHPLGGCRMADDFAGGVVDDCGAVFDGRAADSTYGSLYVWDGSNLPTSLGVNPFLTIAALAERAAASVIAARREANQGPGIRPPDVAAPANLDETPPPYQNAGGPIAVRLQETLRGRLVPAGEWPLPSWPAALQVRMPIPDLLALLQDPRHRISPVSATLNFPALVPEGTLESDNGSVTLLARRAGLPLLRALPALYAWFVKRGWDEIRRRACDWLAGRRQPMHLLRWLRELIALANHAGERRVMHYEFEFERNDGSTLHLSGVKTLRFTSASNIWDSLLDLHVTLRGASGVRASGALRLDLVDLSEHDAPQITAARDLPNALLALASYPLLFLRVMLHTQVWDFRAPDYPSRTRHAPLESQRPLFVESVTLPGSVRVDAERHWLSVQAHAESEEETLPIALTRLRPPRPNNAHGGTPVLLLHGFAQSSYAFVAERLEEDLVRHLLAQGFEVWLLDYRTSTALPSCRGQHTLDEVALYDIPEAVRFVHGETRRSDQQGILAIGHCMGAATLAMSMLAGRLRGGLNGVVLSQVPPFIIGGDYSQFRRQLAAFLRDVVGVQEVNLAADEGASAWESVMDRLFATLPLEDAPCPGGADLQTATCRRVSGIIGPLYRHENMHRTHAQLDRYFGWASISVFNQIAKFFEYERLVSNEGANIYVTDDNIYNHMNLPVMLLHGERNLVFDRESAERSCAQLRRVNPAADVRLAPIPGYAHFDCLVGDRAHVDVYPRISEFLRAHHLAPPPQPARRSV